MRSWGVDERVRLYIYISAGCGFGDSEIGGVEGMGPSRCDSGLVLLA
jgi:hypothetical protein